MTDFRMKKADFFRISCRLLGYNDEEEQLVLIQLGEVASIGEVVPDHHPDGYRVLPALMSGCRPVIMKQGTTYFAKKSNADALESILINLKD